MSGRVETREGANAQPPLAAAIAARQNVFDMTAAAEAAVIRPGSPGGLSHEVRSALAARIAGLHEDVALAAHHKGQLADPDTFASVIDTSRKPDDATLAAFVAYADRVTLDPKSASARDVEALKAAGVSDADIVRLAELVAFLAYQARVLAGVRLVTGA